MQRTSAVHSSAWLSKLERRLEILESYRRSGLTQRAFARQQGIGFSTLELWLRKYGKKAGGEKLQFLPAPNLFPASMDKACYRIETKGGFSVEVRSGFRPEELGEILKVLRSL